jgi:hypothetical protein
MKNEIKIIHLKNERETVASIRDSKVKELEILNKYLFEIDLKIQNIALETLLLKSTNNIKLQKFSSNDSTFESFRYDFLITLNDSDINQFLTTFA